MNSMPQQLVANVRGQRLLLGPQVINPAGHPATPVPSGDMGITAEPALVP